MLNWRVNENTFLGVGINHKLCWKPHIINHVKTKKPIAVLHKTKDILNPNSDAYTFFIRQKRSTRIVNRADYHEPTNILVIFLFIFHCLCI